MAGEKSVSKTTTFKIAREFKMANYLKRCYESLPIKLRLFIAMLVASNTSAAALYGCALLAEHPLTYRVCMAIFLGYRVCAFMANRQMPLIDANVSFMSSERTLWNNATMAVIVTMALVFLGIETLASYLN